jgi:hypothetical protein
MFTVQWNFDNRTSSVIEIAIQAKTEFLISGLAKLDRFVNKRHKKYFIHAKTV